MPVKNFWWHERVQTAWEWDKALCNLVLSTFSASVPPLPATLNIVPSRCDIFFHVSWYKCFLLWDFSSFNCSSGAICSMKLSLNPPDGVNQALLWSPVAWRHLFAAFIYSTGMYCLLLGTVLELFQINIKWFNLHKTTFPRLWMGKVRHREV